MLRPRWGRGRSVMSSDVWQPVPPLPAAEVVWLPDADGAGGVDCAHDGGAGSHCSHGGNDTTVMRFASTEVCVANVDTLTAALALGPDTAALNFANAQTPGGRYTHGGRAQEEDLCRLLPQLYPALLHCSGYPIDPHTALLTRKLLAVRRPGTYKRCASIGQCSIISAAMPCGAADRRPKGGWLGPNSAWATAARLRIRAVLHAALHAGHSNLVLGAFGCGAFGNPAGPVAVIFREQLCAAEFRGMFARVVFAVLDPLGTGNLGPFLKELGAAAKWKGIASSMRTA